MAQISVTVNGQRYALACRDGEEERLRRLCDQVDKMVADLTVRVGQIGEARLLLMASLILADELDEAKAGAAPKADADGVPQAGSKAVDDTLARIEAIVEKMESA